MRFSLILAVALLCQTARAQTPPHLLAPGQSLVRRPVVTHPAGVPIEGTIVSAGPWSGPHDKPPLPGYGVPRVSGHPYPYGWFGAPPRQHWTRHFGYYRNFTQWSAK